MRADVKNITSVWLRNQIDSFGQLLRCGLPATTGHTQQFLQFFFCHRILFDAHTSSFWLSSNSTAFFIAQLPEGRASAAGMTWSVLEKESCSRRTAPLSNFFYSPT